MLKTKEERHPDLNPQETSEWVEALEQVLDQAGPDRASYLLDILLDRAAQAGVTVPGRFTTPYLNTIPVHEEDSLPRRSPAGTKDQEPDPVERSRHGGARQ